MADKEWKCPECGGKMLLTPNKKGGGGTLKHETPNKECSVKFVPVRVKNGGQKAGTPETKQENQETKTPKAGDNSYAAALAGDGNHSTKTKPKQHGKEPVRNSQQQQSAAQNSSSSREPESAGRGDKSTFGQFLKDEFGL